MIDDLKEVTELIDKIKAVLPISAYPTKKLCSSLKNNNGIKVKPKNLLEIADVINMGNEGGICCEISHKEAKELLIVSLTHLRIKKIHPLAKEIKAYQIKRTRELASISYSQT